MTDTAKANISFSFQDIFAVVGFAKTAGIIVAMVVAVSIIPTIFYELRRP